MSMTRNGSTIMKPISNPRRSIEARSGIYAGRRRWEPDEIGGRAAEAWFLGFVRGSGGSLCRSNDMIGHERTAEQMPLHSKNRANVDVAHGPIAQLELILDMSQVAEHDLLCSFSVMLLDGRDERLVFVTHAESRLGGPEEADDQ